MQNNGIKRFLDYADQYLNFEKTPKKDVFWLDSMEYLCKALGNPEKSAECFHVAGSKGKGSISIMIASILESYGKKTGIYSSPHILKFSERISTVNGPFDNEVYSSSTDELFECVNKIKSSEFVMNRPFTWFELVTIYGMLCFRNANVDSAVYEVGLGGRLDATNVIAPEICCISTIELEHTEFLGDTLEKIAAEKGGIIKENTPVVICPQKPNVRKVFENIAKEKNAPVIWTDELCHVSNVEFIPQDSSSFASSNQSETSDMKNLESSALMKFSVASSMFSRPLDISLRMAGSFQVQNALVAACAVKKVFPEISCEVIEDGLSRAVLPGRFEIVRSLKEFPNIKSLVLDGAHTPNSVAFTLETLEKIFPKEKNVYLIFGCAKDKNVEEMVSMFKGKFSRVYLTKPGEVKESDLEKIRKAFDSNSIEYYANENYIKTIYAALKSASESNAVCLVTGSFYLVSEVKKCLSN